METLFYYLPLAWFKNHPLQLPSSTKFFWQNLIVYYLIWFFVQANMIPVLEAFFEVTIETVLTVLFVVAILALNRTMHNFIQVASAVMFCENVVSVLMVPVAVWLTVTHDFLSYTALVILMVWDFSMITYVMKKVLGVDIWAGLIVAVFYFALTYALAYGLTVLIV